MAAVADVQTVLVFTILIATGVFVINKVVHLHMTMVLSAIVSNSIGGSCTVKLWEPPLVLCKK